MKSPNLASPNDLFKLLDQIKPKLFTKIAIAVIQVEVSELHQNLVKDKKVFTINKKYRKILTKRIVD